MWSARVGEAFHIVVGLVRVCGFMKHNFDLNDNELASTIENALPDSIGQLTGLKKLYLRRNRPRIFNRRSPAVQAWLQALEDSGVTAYGRTILA